jgi:hypothetical protein
MGYSAVRESAILHHCYEAYQVGIRMDDNSMTIIPRHLAAIQYSTIAVCLAVSWWVLLSPIERARGQLDFIFSPGHENRKFFIWLAISTITTTLMAISFWLKRATNIRFSALLVFASTILLGVAIRWFDTTFIVAYFLGFACSVWSWSKPMNQDPEKSQKNEKRT